MTQRNLSVEARIGIGLGMLGCLSALGAATIFIAPDGNDRNPGTESQPLATLAHARERVRAVKSRTAAAIDVVLRRGTYYLSEPLVFSAEDSGRLQAPVTWRAAEGEAVVISGGTRLRLNWTPLKDGIWQAGVPGVKDGKLAFDQFFLDGRRQRMARYPNYDPQAKYYGGTAADALSPERVKRWSHPVGAFVHGLHRHEWGGFHYRIAGVDAEGKVKLEGGWGNNRRMGLHDQHRFVENVYEELDAPGEWYLDLRQGLLYFMPPARVDLATARIEVARLKHLIEFRGTAQQPVCGITLKGLTFTHTARTFTETSEPLLRSDWTIYRGGAVRIEGAEDCTVDDCWFDQVGGNAIFVNHYNRRVTVSRCKITEAGASGICFVGDPKAVRSPSFEYGQSVPLEQLDREPGPKSSNYPAQCGVQDCLIHSLGQVEKQIAGVQIAMAEEIKVSHCSIYDLPRAGINIGDGCWGGHIIEFCDVFDTVKESGDHGSFNSWGRDRYWLPEIAKVNRMVAAHPDLILLEARKPTILRHNRWRCDHGWDIDLDDGSSHFILENNLCLNGGIKLREGFHRTVQNNIMVNNSFHPHVWFDQSGDVFAHNIVMTGYRPIGMPQVWGKQIDSNLLPNADALAQSRKLGLDARGEAGDPQFIDPAKGDFRVEAGSPALKIGFRNFPTDTFGVVSPKLRAEAQVPPIPVVRLTREMAPVDSVVHSWLGARIKRVSGLGEVSAAGLPGEVGVLLSEVPTQSRAAQCGLRPRDVILRFDDKAVTNAVQFLQLYQAAPAGQKINLAVFRHQRELRLSIEAPATAAFPGKPSRYQGFDRFDFSVDGKPATVVVPAQAAAGKPWVWYATFFGVLPGLDQALLTNGFHVVYLDVPDMLGCPEVIPPMNAFYRELTERYGLAKKTALAGVSRGGLYCYNWALANLDKVACIYGDAPVCDFKSWPGGKGKGRGNPPEWQRILERYHFQSEAEAMAYEKNPVDNLAPLAAAKVPLLHVYGEADIDVPPSENTAVLAERYRKLGGAITLIPKPGVAHHPHGLDDPAPVVEFIMRHSAP